MDTTQFTRRNVKMAALENKGPLEWDQQEVREYETGTAKGVLYLDGKGVAWSGLTSVKQSPDGAEPNDFYADNIKYLSIESAENFKGTIEAYTYPDEFSECDGSKAFAPGVKIGQQRRRSFGLVYSTIVGNAELGIDYGEKLHIIYNAKVSPSERAYTTVNDSPEPLNLSWAFSTTPAVSKLEGVRPTSYICIELHKLGKDVKKALLDKLYGTEGAQATLPPIDELLEIVKKTEI